MSTTKGIVTRASIQGIADGIRYANGSDTQYKPAEMESAVRALKKTFQSKTISPTASQQTVQPDSGFDGLSSVTVLGDADLIAGNIKKDVDIFGVTGNYEGEGGGSASWNENLVLNWDFTNPINTRGNSSYESASSILTINGWNAYASILQIVTGGIKVSKRPSSSQANIYQFPTASCVQYLLGKQITMSIFANNELSSKTVTINSSTGFQLEETHPSGLKYWIYRDSSTQMSFSFGGNGDLSDVLIQAVKVEFGDTQTLAHEENGVWVLNKNQVAEMETYKKSLVNGW